MLDFSRIVALRQLRLDRMLKAENAEKAAASEALSSLDAAEKATENYLEETRTLEIDLLTTLLNRKVSVNDLLAVEETLKRTKEKARELADRRAECQDQLARAKERARIAGRNRLASALKLNKGRHLHEHLRLRKINEANLHEEAALEEFCDQLSARARA